jgi:EAL and modified HD-GYP domain-containing signal transduction protein
MLDTLEIALARQPIFDRADQLVAYELLYRNRSTDTCANGGGRNSAQMSSDTIAGTFLGFGLERVTGGKTAYVNVDRTMLLDGSVLVLDPKTVVLEILETVGCDEEILAACRGLVDQGYVLALDDFVFQAGYEPLIRLATIVKLDVLGKSPDELRALMDRVRPFGVRCLAERVEDAAMRAECAALGFDLFQGYFFARPETLGGRDIPLDQVNIIRLLNLLLEPNTTDLELEALFKADVLLTYRLLRIVNSASTGQLGVTSIGHGIRLLGRTMLHRWMALLLISSLATNSSGTTDELVQMALVRGRFSELLMESLGRRRECPASFVAGLFSLLDALLQIPMAELVNRVNLTDEIREALLSRRGPFAAPLCVVESCESARWADLLSAVESLDVSPDDVPQLYVRAVEWARMIVHQTDVAA